MTDQIDTATAPETLMDRRLYVQLKDLFEQCIIFKGDGRGTSVRLRNCLANENMRFVGDLYHHFNKADQNGDNEKALLRTPNLGRKSLDELKEFLENIGLTLDNEPVGTALWGALDDDLIEASPVSAEELQHMLRDPSLKTVALPQSTLSAAMREAEETGSASYGGAHIINETSSADVITDELIFAGEAQSTPEKADIVNNNAGTEYDADLFRKVKDLDLSTTLKNVFSYDNLTYIGDIFTAYPSDAYFLRTPNIGPKSLQNLNQQLSEINPNWKIGLVSLSQRDWVNAVAQYEGREPEPRPQPRAIVPLEDAAADALTHLTDAQKALLQPQEIVINDGDIQRYQAMIPTGVFPAADFISHNHLRPKLAIALATLQGEAPHLLYLTKTDTDYQLTQIVGLVGKLTEDNVRKLDLVTEAGWHEREDSYTQGNRYQQFSARPDIFGEGHEYFLTTAPNALLRAGIKPLKPKVVVKTLPSVSSDPA